MRTLILGAATALSSLANAAEAPAVWSTCAACHAAAGAAAIGPPLVGIVGRRSGSVPGFGYSRAMKGSGLTWDEATLARFIGDPQKTVPGNRMPFAGVSDPGEVASLVEFLKTLR